MKIYTSNNELFLEPRLSDGYRLKYIMGDNTLTLQYSLDYYIEVPQGAWCTFKNETYFLMSAQQPTKISDSHFDYKLIFDTDVAKTKTQVFEFIELIKENNGTLTITNDPTPEFSLTGHPEDHLKMLVDCMNYKDPARGWAVGEYIDSDEITIDYSHNFCWDVLSMLADKFNTEWEVEGKTIHLRKVEKMKDSAIPLSYGYNKGLLSGITRTTFKEPIGRLVIKTSDRNIDRSVYGSRTLKMPRKTSTMHEGVEYITDATGTKLQRKVPLMDGILPESSLDITKIYPRRVGTVTEVIIVDDSKGLYDIKDNTIPDDLNFKEMIIPGEKMIIIFQSGQLSGVGGGNGFESGYTHPDRRFTLVPINDNGLIYPQGTLIPAVGDKYAVFHINMPERYITDGENELLSEALKYFVENEQPQYTYKATLDELYAKRKWLEIGGYLNLGYFVRISEPAFIPEPVDIRIVSVKEYVDKEKQPIIEMSNSVTGRSTFASNNNSAQTQNQTNNRIEGNAIEFTKRRFRDAQETMLMLQESLLHFSGAINPITVQTMLLLVGDESLQFRFVDSKTNPIRIPHAINYNNEAKTLHADAGILQHMTLGIDSISSSHKPEDYHFWNMAEYISPVLTEAQAKYFIYAKVERSGTSGIFLMSETAIEMESDPNYYHLLVGTLNSEFENDRSYVELYGFTEVLPGRITTDRIVSSDGLNFFDFVSNSFRVGNEDSAIEWNLIKNLLKIINATVEMQNADGDTIAKIDGEDGSAMFSKGNANFAANGDVDFANNTHKFNRDGSLSLANNNILWDLLNGLIVTGRFESNKDDYRIVIDPKTRSFNLVDPENMTKVYIGQLNEQGQVAPTIRIGDEDGGIRGLMYPSSLNYIDSLKVNEIMHTSLTPYGFFINREKQGVSKAAINVSTNISGQEEVLFIQTVNMPTAPTGLLKGQWWDNNGVPNIVR